MGRPSRCAGSFLPKAQRRDLGDDRRPELCGGGAGAHGTATPGLGHVGSPRPGALHAPTDAGGQKQRQGGAFVNRTEPGLRGLGVPEQPSLHPPCPGRSTPSRDCPAGILFPRGNSLPIAWQACHSSSPLPSGWGYIGSHRDCLLRRRLQHTVGPQKQGHGRERSKWPWHRRSTTPLTREMELNMKFLSPSKLTDFFNKLRRRYSRRVRTDPGSTEDGDVNGGCNHLENNLSLCIHQPGQAGG